MSNDNSLAAWLSTKSAINSKHSSNIQEKLIHFTCAKWHITRCIIASNSIYSEWFMMISQGVHRSCLTIWRRLKLRLIRYTWFLFRSKRVALTINIWVCYCVDCANVWSTWIPLCNLMIVWNRKSQFVALIT